MMNSRRALFFTVYVWESMLLSSVLLLHIIPLCANGEYKFELFNLSNFLNLSETSFVARFCCDLLESQLSETECKMYFQTF